MEHKEKEFVIDIENGDANGSKDSSSDSTWGKKILKRIGSGILNLNGSVDDEAGVKSDVGTEEELDKETTKLLSDKARGGEEGEGVVPPVERDNERGGEGRAPPVEKERRKGGKAKKAAKPPRPPKGPTLDAADMRLLKEISRLAIKKRERMEHLKALKKNKSPKLSSPSSSSSSSSACSSAATISAMFVTIFFFLVLILRGLNASTSSTLIITGAPQPQPPPQMRGLLPVQFYKTFKSNGGGTLSFLPPKCVFS
ncbi:uncharacterized protein LOC121791663 isoform X1 [Salvia splendens]|uniref:uncharacterized protein LOC121740943 isoform X1 n=1 Tax=Salvia splendens TaxID=180675 RepID=UPI001C27FC6B|nr:uncharacterized protein LOC121740943 isoform X1 [Salvia splendens]XP_042045464.1 uncharacterized protein LOC121791663 isoform X1 [Salvia splendens]